MPQKIGIPLLKRLISKPPDREVEIRDSELKGFCIKSLPSGSVRFYVQVARGRRETIAHPQGSGRRAVKRTGEGEIYPVDAKDVIDRKKDISLIWIRNEARRLQGAQIGGEDFNAQRQAEKEIPTFGDYLDTVYGPWLIDNPEHQHGADTLERLKVFSCFNGSKLNTITPRRLDSWRTRRLKAVEPETVNRDLTALKSAFSTYAEWNKQFDDPLKGYKLISVDGDKKIVVALDEDRGQVTALLAALEARDDRKRVERVSGNAHRKARAVAPLPSLGVYCDCLTPAVIVSIETGLRRGELFQLQWPFVRFDKREIQVAWRTSKTKKERIIWLSDRAHKVLRDWWLQNGQPKRGRVFPVTNLKKSYYKVIADAGIERVRADGKKINWHSLRHTFGSRLGARGIDAETIRELMGHSDIKTTQRYLHSSDDRKRAAIEALA